MDKHDNKDCLFRWVKKRGSNVKKDIQFYESFMLNGVYYSLYDNAYFFKDGDVDPHIGKIVRIWEKDDGAKKVKILWFFHPYEISNYIKDYEPLENELFLASGDGLGLANVNPLETISGKCSVTCISKDIRNSQPSKDELEKSDFVFSRTFDVGKLVICDVLPDEIAGLKVGVLLNKKDCGLSRKTEGESSKKLSHPEGAIPDENKEKNDAQRDLLLNVESSQGREKDGINSAQSVDEKVSSAKHKTESDLCPDKPSNQRVEERVAFAKRKAEPVLCDDKPSTTRVDEKDEKAATAKQLHLKAPYVDLAISSKINTPVERRIIEVTRKPDMERSKWFKGPSWEERIPKANNQGTLMFLQFFDQSLTSTAIEDIIYSVFKHICSARVLPVISSYRNPHYASSLSTSNTVLGEQELCVNSQAVFLGQAYVIFKTQEATNETIRGINTGCLLLPDGSSFFASKGMLDLPPKATEFPGHITVNSKKTHREEMRNAVSTSHCSQPNTIEYEMALEWILLQEKTALRFEELHKIHGEELKEVKKKLKAI